MPSKAEQVAAAVVAALEAYPPLAGVPVFRDRDDAIGGDEPSLILVELADEDTETLGHGMDQDKGQVAVVYVVRGANWQTVADGLRVHGHVALMQSPALRSVVAKLKRVRAEWKSANAEQPFAYLAQVYQATYLTPTQSLDAA